MKIKEVRINNYKSLGGVNNRIILNDVTCIIGKNESGKTNIIEALSQIKMRGTISAEYFKKNNRVNNEKISLEFILEPYKIERSHFRKITDTKVLIMGQDEIYIDGGVSEVIINDKEFMEARTSLFDLIKTVRIPFDENTRTYFNRFTTYLRNIDKQVMVFGKYIDSFKNIIISSQVAEKDEIINCIDTCVIRLTEIYELFPKMFFVDSNSLKTEYKSDEIKTPKDSASMAMLHMFLEVSKIELSSIEKYWNTSNSAEKKDLLDEFNKSIGTNITEKFNTFYTQDSVSCSILLDNQTISIQIKTNGKSMEFSERSNGLKWYFNSFIKMSYSNLSENNIVYLLDEPGVFLHVNAQKELLSFFKDLSSKGNQIIYTTHSPYMIDQENMGEIRLVAKEKNLYTSISNNYNSFPVNTELGTQETLAPLLYAIGLDLKYNIGPDKGKINIVVEGISDYYYLNTYIKLKNKKDNNIYIIPSVGASQINKVVSILIGWGYDYRVLLDNDKSGRDEYKVLINKLNVSNDTILFTDETRILNTSITHEIENVFSNADYQKIVTNTPDYNDKKKIVALDIYNRAIKREKVYDENTMKKFDTLINKIINKND